MSNSKKSLQADLTNAANHKMANPDASVAQGLSRRDFLRAAAAVTGGTAIASSNLAAQAAEVSKQAMASGGEHAAHATGHASHQMGQYGSMMFMEGHSMKPGQIIEPPGSPSPSEVNYKVFDIDVRIVEHEILPGIKTHVFAFNGQVPGPEFHVTEGD